MSDIGGLVERLVGLGVSISDASDVVAKAFAAGAASAPHRTPRKPKQLDLVPDPPKRATRLPADFVCDMAYAAAQGLNPRIAAREAERFRDFWSAKPGKDGVKADWPATWRNWVRSTADRMGAIPRPPSPTGASGVDPRKLTADEWRPILAIYAKTSNWNPQYGPEPGLPGSLAPSPRQSAFL
jgi:hypothetical protein